MVIPTPSGIPTSGSCTPSNQQGPSNAASQVSPEASVSPKASVPKKVLRIVVEKYVHPITINELVRVFKQCGTVRRIVLFGIEKDQERMQALLEMSDPAEAATAKLALDGRNLYKGNCTLRIDFSDMSSLQVKYNNEKSYDYTKKLPYRDIQQPNGSVQQLYGAVQQPYHSVQQLYGSVQQPYGSVQQPYGSVQQPYGSVQQPYGSVQQQMLLPYGSSQQQMVFVPQNLLQQGNNGIQLVPFTGNRSSSSVLHLTNLNESEVTNPDILFTLLGVFGDVHRVKILYKKRSSALVQMANAAQAELARKHLDGKKLFGKPLHISESKHGCVQMPKEGQDEFNLTRDYTNSNLHRFKKAGSKNFSHIYPPSKVLHLSNIPEGITNEFIMDAFNKHSDVIDFNFFAKDRRMALLTLPSVEVAINCLVKMHNYPLTDTHGLRVSFSKSHL